MVTQAALQAPRELTHPGISPRKPGPFVKWAGGKGRLLGQLLPLLPRNADQLRHVEPFVGGGAMFFARMPSSSLLCDSNATLMSTYEAVRDEVEEVIDVLIALARKHSIPSYYSVRAQYNTANGIPKATRAAMFIYLNKTCFNGLHRVNARGEFNVPAGRYQNPRVVN